MNAILLAFDRHVAFDRKSARFVDVQGYMHVDDCNISKAIVNYYLGEEIPNSEELGLDPNARYAIFRDPVELEKAAPTFNNLPLLDHHIAVSAMDFEDPKIKQHIVGSTGTNARFVGPYLKNSLVIWTAGAIDGVTTKEQTELSCAYRYTIDMTPGEYEGVHYDGRMLNIIGNHVALVVEGRAGSDVIVADAALSHEEENDTTNQLIVTTELGKQAGQGNHAHTSKENQMGKHKGKVLTAQGHAVRGALLTYLQPRLAADEAFVPGEVEAILQNITYGRYEKQIPGIVGTVMEKFKGRLAADASLDDLAAILEALKTAGEVLDGHGAGGALGMAGDPDGEGELEGDDFPPKDPNAPPVDPNAPPVDPNAGGNDKEAAGQKLMEMLSHYQLPDNDLETLNSLIAVLSQKEKPKMPEQKVDPATQPQPITKPAMDEALAAHDEITRVKIQNLFRAGEEVKPHIGEIDLMSMDSAETVYKLCLDTKKVDITGVPPEAYRALVKMLPDPKTGEVQVPVLAADANIMSEYRKQFPNVPGKA